MSQTIEFSVVGGGPVGTATLADGGLEYSSDAVREIMAGRCAVLGDEKAFRSFVDWSNGYMTAKLLSGP